MFQYFHFIEILLFIVSTLFAIGYILLLSKIIDGWDDTLDWEIPKNFKPNTKVSVIVAARNEEKSINTCIQSILDCNYPKDMLEVIVVNDHSEDETERIVKTLDCCNLTLINLDDVKGKKSALEKGIGIASGTLIACTDADCTVSQDWLMLAVSYFEENDLKCIAGPISYLCDNSILQRFQYLDALNNMCVTANGIQKQSYYMANGANLFFTKKVFEEVGGHDLNSKLASGDDMFLIQKISDKYPHKVAFIKTKEAIVSTLPETTLAELINQRTRWATKSKAYTNKMIIRIQGFVFCFVVLIILSLVLSVFGSRLSLFGFLLALFIKWTIDYLYLSKLADFFNDRKPLKSFIPASIGFLSYIVFAGWKALVPTKYNWKGRKVS